MRTLFLRRYWHLLFVTTMLLTAACGEDDLNSTTGPEFVAGEVAVIPRPVEVRVDAGGSQFTFTRSTRILVEAGHAELENAANVLYELLAPHLPGLAAPVSHADERVPRGAVVINASEASAALGEDGYELSITSSAVVLQASSGRGALHGVHTLRQLLPAEIELASPLLDPVVVPSVRILDRPRFAWRGLMLDVGRTFFPISYLHRWLELMALHKLSVFHLHLTDDQGWRIESAAFPDLHQLASRFDSVRFPEERNGYYTKDELRELVTHAERLGIEIVPEIDLPGHSVALLHALPALACRLDSNQPRQRDEFSIHPWSVGPFIHEEIVCACDDGVYGVLETILDEVLDIFPGQFVHLGGDEVPKAEWQQSAQCDAFMATNALQDFEHLQAHFTKHFEQFLATRGRTLIAWDEALEATTHGDDRTLLSAGTALMHWRNFLPDAADLYDHPVVQTPFTALYLDYYSVPLERTYTYEPVPDGLTPAQEANVLGAQGNMWTGFAPQRTEERVDAYVFPRLAALAEIAWSPRDRRDYDDFLARYVEHKRRLEYLGVNTTPCEVCVP
jgi:hexosaminidase